MTTYRLESINITQAGTYGSRPILDLEGPGIGAAFIEQMDLQLANVERAHNGLGSYAPGDTITLPGGVIISVDSTKVSVATVSTPGTGGTPGPATVTGTTGTGTKFEALVSISGGGAITSVDSITVAGSYTVNPTDRMLEPVTGGGLVGATLALLLGVDSSSIDDRGVFTSLPSNPIPQLSTSGEGTGARFNAVFWGVLSPIMTDHGTGYTLDSTLSITGGSETNPAEYTLTLTAENPYPLDSLNIDKPASWINADGYRGVIGVLPNIPNEDGDADEIVVVPVEIENLPDVYSVVVTADQHDVSVTVSDKTTLGFNINLKPLSGESIAEGFLDAVLVGSK